MKISESWLRQWVNPNLVIEEIAEQLTMAGLEVDSISPVAGAFDNVIVAYVRNTRPHPQADKLTLCDVDVGEDSLYQVVCGAPNVHADMKVAMAKIGATLPGGFKIKEAKLRGELSQGMLCSASELGLTDTSEGILELPEDAPVGEDFRHYYALNDSILDIDLTPNRADCLSILGISREVAALNAMDCKSLETAHNKPSHDEILSVNVDAPEACPQYCGRIIRQINTTVSTPLWMKERLRRSGIRALHPVVDVTNYVMLELGQPLHAFDLNKIQPGIHVRTAKSDETLVLLNGDEIELTDDILVIADQKGPIALAGVMGGEHSAVQNDTVDIFLESAFFTPSQIAGVARRFGLFTDSSQRFERGVDPALQTIALERATELLIKLAGGEAGPIITVTKPGFLPQVTEIAFNPCRVKQVTGVAIAEEKMAAFLKQLGMKINQQQRPWLITPPSYRFDIQLEVDLIEEMIRLHGYQAIEGELTSSTLQSGLINPFEQLTKHLSHFLAHRGYHETISYSFVDPELQAALYPNVSGLSLINPISSELSQMRLGLWPGLIASLIYNLHRQQTAFKLFETGVIFEHQGEEVIEHACLAGLLSGEHGHLNWNEDKREFDFFDIKGDLEALFASLNLTDAKFIAGEHPALHPGKTAQIMLDEYAIGWVGALHPKLADELELTCEVLLFELRLELLTKLKKITFQPISKYPLIRRDLSLLMSESTTVDQIQEVVTSVVPKQLLKGFHVFDLYQGPGIPDGKKSLAIALTLQADDRTLIDDEINVIMSAIINKLQEVLNITLRE